MNIPEANSNSRLEAFCDGVFAIALTLLIIELKIPHATGIGSTRDLWEALWHLTPSVFAFLLSFVIILITWVNHHAAIRRVRRSSAAFIYANGFLLLTVVFTPFPTALLGEYLMTDHAAPAVVLYNAVLVMQAVGWILLTTAALRGGLSRDDAATAEMLEGRRSGYFAVGLYSACAIMALGFPLAIAAVTTLSWVIWLVMSMRAKHA